MEKNCFMKKSKIEINIDDNLSLNKPLKFSTLTLIVTCVFEKGEKIYQEIYLDECLYEL